MLSEIFVPVLCMVFLERWLVYRCLRTPAQLDWVRRQWWLHPNAISRARYPMGFATVLLFQAGWMRTAVIFFAFWMITDLTDGEIARRCNLSSEKGETIDPLSDKFMYLPILVYFAWRGRYEPWLVGIFVAVDVFGQVSRSFIRNKAANLFGKAKTFQVVVLLGLT
ncbi:MAG: CDP-alcohol phosphatidyltransferase family protein, partial [Deltaproteobacteria bacterium]|nr:CDP-alcohol phosphatidyltransferase family protein [Deltaproteobacteria bacterium]